MSAQKGNWDDNIQEFDDDSDFWGTSNQWVEDIEESDDSDKIEDGNAIIPDHLYKVYKEKTASVISKIEDIGVPTTGQQIRLITMQSFNSVAFIEMIAEREIIEHATMVIFAINLKAAYSINELFKEGKIKKIDLVISSVRNAGYAIKSKAVEFLSKNKDISMCFVNSHAKISALRTAAGNYYIVEGSGNFSYNGRIEQYVIDNDKYMFDFTIAWVDEMKKTMHSYKDFKIVNA